MDELQPGEDRGTLVDSTAPISGTIYSLMPKISKAIGAVAKGRQVKYGGTNFSFRGIEDLINACHAPFSEHGVFCLPEVLESDLAVRPTKNGDQYCTMVLIKVTFYAADGSSVSATVKGEACDSADKSVNKAQSSALKTLLIWAFMIPTESDEGGGHDDRPQYDNRQQSYSQPRQDDYPRSASESGQRSQQPESQSGQQSQPDPENKMSKEQVEFNQLVMPAIKEGRITRDKVKELLKNVAGDYLSALSLVKGHLEITKNNPPHTGDAL